MKKTTRSDESSVPEKLAAQDGLKPGVAKEVSEATGVPAADVYGVGSFFHLLARPDAKIRVCQGLSCWMAGGGKILAQAQEAGLPAEGCSCLAACDRPVAVLRDRLVLPAVESGDITAAKGDWKKLSSSSISDDDTWLGHVGPENASEEDLAINLEGKVDFSGRAFAKAMDIGTARVIEELEASGLQGRGGAGFPTARKWRSLLDQEETTRYVVLNADEGEPGTFKDREIIMRRPDTVIEGLAIAASSIGAKDVYCYLRGEFESPLKVLKDAIEKFQKSNANLEINFHIHEGQGAYICGEESSLLEALEGRRGMPRLRPPFPTESGLWHKPTLIHNVETIACIPAIINRGGKWFHDLGITAPGSKIYCISGDVKKPGVYELPLGVSLDQLVEAAGGYDGNLKAFSPGGASSGFLPAAERERPLDWKSLSEVGSSLGSAGAVVLNEDVDIVEAVRETLVFFENESCGQCAPCRIGSRFQRESLDRFLSSHQEKELDLVDDVAWEMGEGSICGLGHVASVPLVSARKWFPEEFK